MADIESLVIADPDFGEVVVTAHNAKVLKDSEWDANYLEYVRQILKRGTTEQLANMVFAEGKGPSAKQRGAANAIFGKDQRYRLQVSVVTSSMMVRGAVTALSWFNPLIRAFSPGDWHRAAEHARITQKHHAKLRAAAEQLRSRVPDCEVLNRCLDQSRLRAG